MASESNDTPLELSNGGHSTDQLLTEKSRPMDENKNVSVDEYFTSYTDIDVHELMLKDRPRTLAYRKFFKENSEQIRGKVVLDVGAGTGILSLFAAAAGAAKVYAIEASGMAKLCREIVVANGLDEKIQVIQGRVEDDVLPEGTKVDVIVSEWMGFYLFHESMLDSVICARDKYLTPEGLLVPSHASLKITPASMEKYYNEHFDYWNSVYGFDFSPVLPIALEKSRREPIITEVPPDELLSAAQDICCIDLKSVSLDEVKKISSTLTFTINSSSELHGFVCWFDVLFKPICVTERTTTPAHFTTKENEVTSPVILSTAPSCPVTHWKQTTFLLPETLSVDKGDNICIQVVLSQDESNKRHYNISIELQNSDDDVGAEYSEEESTDEHEVPCDCDAPRCRLIKAVMEKYDTEHREIEAEADLINAAAGAVASQQLDSEMTSDGNNDSIQDEYQGHS
ncbi:probable protein arginine N-methyltransferase 6.1 [Gigantopelta aegis]|uniref:probable protein arginine N-methyltransferase 6.1 n=1 Tax=Gigantopelta aegis TaxID=1735272 RepID=UPI001B88986A|nr:probable protein arginine N-methyltransferase 6.1 [Gigantopelta aegis]